MPLAGWVLRVVNLPADDDAGAVGGEGECSDLPVIGGGCPGQQRPGGGERGQPGAGGTAGAEEVAADIDRGGAGGDGCGFGGQAGGEAVFRAPVAVSNAAMWLWVAPSTVVKSPTT